MGFQWPGGGGGHASGALEPPRLWPARSRAGERWEGKPEPEGRSGRGQPRSRRKTQGPAKGTQTRRKPQETREVLDLLRPRGLWCEWGLRAGGRGCEELAEGRCGRGYPISGSLGLGKPRPVEGRANVQLN